MEVMRVPHMRRRRRGAMSHKYVRVRSPPHPVTQEMALRSLARSLAVHRKWIHKFIAKAAPATFSTRLILPLCSPTPYECSSKQKG